MPPRTVWLVALTLVLSALVLSVSCYAQAGAPAKSNGDTPQANVEAAARPAEIDDAELADVFFVDRMNGWAVGDHGAIWRTTNGGRTWRSQPTPTRCRLDTVWFVDEQTGWAAGGERVPFTDASRAVLLRTNDGGWHWSRMDTPDLPAIHALRFIGPNTAVAVGDTSSLHPSGIWLTRDGARNWTPKGTAAPAGWAAASIGDTSGSHVVEGVLVGHDGAVARWTRDGFARLDEPPFDGRRITAVSKHEHLVWLVGEGGLVLQSKGELGSAHDAGSAEVINLPSTARNFDFLAVESVGQRVWAAGRPGSVVFHSPDGGKTWEQQPTRQTLPIRDLCFIDEQHGWAVGAMGTILATEDGGDSWRVQRGSGRRAAWLALFGRPEDVPYEWIAELGAEKGYRGVVEIANRRYTPPSEVNMRGQLLVADPRDADVAAHVHEATVLAGGCGADMAWAFPIPASGLRLEAERIAPAWSQLNDGASLAALEEWMVRAIRTWRPDVVLTHPAAYQATGELERTIGGLILTAVDKAGDAGEPGGHAESIPLPPWKVTKVFGLMPAGQSGTCTTTPWRLSPTLGHSPASLAMRARGLLSEQFAASPDRIDLSLTVNNLPQGVGERDVFAGIHLAADGEARRAESTLHSADVQGLRQVARKHRNITALLTRFAADDSQTFGVLGEVGRLVEELDDEAAALVLFQLAHQFAQRGRWQLAEETLDQIVTSYGSTSLAPAARNRLVAHRTSGEVAWATQRQAAEQQNSGDVATGLPQRQMSPWGGFTAPTFRKSVMQTETAKSEAVVRSGRLRLNPATFKVDGRSPTQPAVTSTPTTPTVPPADGDDAAWAVVRSDVQLRSDPATLLAMAAQSRRSGQHDQAAPLLREVIGLHEHDHWGELARAEEWLARRSRTSSERYSDEDAAPIDSVVAKPAVAKPRLDGQLDDPLWQEADEAPLRNPLDAGFGSASVRFAYDDAYLYVAVRCERRPEVPYPAETVARPRDGDLSERDRCEIRLDVDRDYRTAYELTVDHRGWTADRCWDSPAWNPTWYVAAQLDEQYWTAEAAIAWEDLVETPPVAGDAWAVAIRRVVPRIGIQSWREQPAERCGAHESGLLRFE